MWKLSLTPREPDLAEVCKGIRTERKCVHNLCQKPLITMEAEVRALRLQVSELTAQVAALASTCAQFHQVMRVRAGQAAGAARGKADAYRYIPSMSSRDWDSAEDAEEVWRGHEEAHARAAERLAPLVPPEQ